jgi:hypothetical protein
VSFAETTPTEPPAGSPVPAQPEPAGSAEPTWGGQRPAGQRPRWSAKKTAIAVAVAVVIAGGGGAAIAAAAGNSSSTTGGPGGGLGGFPGGSGYGARGGAAQGAGLAALSGALHGDFVVKSSSGSYTTERMQTGKATSVSSTSITVASDDGYTSTYAIDSATSIEDNNQQAGSVTSGETVTVLATVSADVATATTVDEGTTTAGGVGSGSGSRGEGGFGGPGGGSGGPGGFGN